MSASAMLVSICICARSLAIWKSVGVLKLAATGGASALAAGLGMALVASQLRPVFMNGTDLRAKTGLPVLGVISLAMTEVERRRERLSLYRFAGASGGLVGLFIFGLVGMALFARSG